MTPLRQSRDEEADRNSPGEREARTEPESDFDKVAGWDELLPSERSPLRFYLNEIGRTPLLSQEEETALARRIHKGDAKARDHMIRANLRLVVRIARDYENFGLPFLDLVAEGNIGLMKAVERFDPDKGGKLSTYAAWWIRQALKRALATHGKTIRLPMHMVDRIALMRRTINSLIEEIRREPTNEEIALVMELPVRKIVHLRSVATRAASLDAPVGEEGDATFGDLLGDESQRDPFRSLLDKSIASEMDVLLEKLEPREAEIIRLRFGLSGDRERTLEEVGAMYGLTRERVRQLQHLAIMKLRRLLADFERQRTSRDLREEAIESARVDTLNEFFRKKQSESEEKAMRLSKAVKMDPPSGGTGKTAVASTVKPAKSAPKRRRAPRRPR